MAKILLVEDDEQLRRLLVRQLEADGHAVISARDPRQALAQLSHEPTQVDLLVIDAVLPGLSGPALAEQLQTQQPGTPVLFVTGLQALAIQIAYEGPCRVLTKPFQLKMLQVQVQSLLTESAPRRDSQSLVEQLQQANTSGTSGQGS